MDVERVEERLVVGVADPFGLVGGPFAPPSVGVEVDAEVVDGGASPEELEVGITPGVTSLKALLGGFLVGVVADDGDAVGGPVGEA